MKWLQQLTHDMRFGCRTLATAPAFALLAVLSLALGIMATTAIYSVLHAVVLDPFPYKDVDRLASVRVWSPEQRGSRLYYSTDQFLEIAERSTIFDGVIASTISDVLWTGGGDPQRLRGNYGTPNTFEVMGVPALVGRYYMPDDVQAGADPVAVLGYRFWQRQFGGDVTVVGKQLRLNNQVRTIIGVMPKRFMWRGADVYLPVVFQRGRVIEGVRTVHLLGRVKPGVTDARAESDLKPIVEELARKEPAQFPSSALRVGLLSFKETFPSSIRQNLWVLFGAVGLLLLIACANVSNLLLSRAAGRQREMAVRAALGGSRARLVRQLLTESVLLAVVAGVLGTALAYAALGTILGLVPPGTIPDESEVALNVPVLLFTLLVTLMTSVIFGLAPALHTCSGDLARPLRSSGRGTAGGQALLRKGLVVSAVALSIVLMVGASLMIRTTLAISRVDLGLQPDRVLTARVPLPEQKYDTRERRVRFFDEVMRGISEVPGVTAVAVNTGAHPFGNAAWPIEVPGSSASDQPVLVHQVSADYTRAVGIPLVRGRGFAVADVSGRRQLALVNQAFERVRLRGADAVGRVIRVPQLTQPPIGSSDPAVEIIGVVQDTLNRGLTDELLPEIYLPYTLAGLANRLMIRTAVEPSSLTRPVIDRIHSTDPDQAVTEVRPLASLLDDFEYAGPRFNVVLLSIFAGLGLLLAVVGVYGVMSSLVSQQMREIGVRMALGADPRAVAAVVVKSGGVLLIAGVGIGLIGSVFTSRLLSQQIWNVSTVDPISFAAVSLVLLAAGLQACAWPAWRAARTEPTVVLRQE